MGTKKENKGAGKCGMGAFNVVKKSTEGVEMPLTLPDGTATEEHLVVRGADSTKFQGAKAKANRELLTALKKSKDDPEKRQALQDSSTRKILASLVVGWSFDEECNEVNVLKFFADAPQVQEQVGAFAGERTNFFVKPPQD